MFARTESIRQNYDCCMYHLQCRLSGRRNAADSSTHVGGSRRMTIGERGALYWRVLREG